LVDPCSLAFAKANEHHIDYAAGMSPDPEHANVSICHVDEQAATTYLGSLRDELIWPATVWGPTLGSILDSMKGYQAPGYDDCDKCEFCEDVKGKFLRGVSFLKVSKLDSPLLL
jgi:hypothetical protein